MKLAIVLPVMLLVLVVKPQEIPFKNAGIVVDVFCMLPAVVVLPIVLPDILKAALGIPPVLIPVNVIKPVEVPAIVNEPIMLLAIEPEKEDALDISIPLIWVETDTVFANVMLIEPFPVAPPMIFGAMFPMFAPPLTLIPVNHTFPVTPGNVVRLKFFIVLF